MVGQTFGTIIAQQFEALRDGDRFWYHNQGFDAKTLSQIESTTLSDIIDRNTDTAHIQSDAFVYYNRHTGTAGGIAAEDPNAPQLVVASNGLDKLFGGPKGDILVAAAGEETMTGGGGRDIFDFSQQHSSVIITDYQDGQDKLEFENLRGLTLRDVHIHADHGNTVLDVGNDHIVMLGVDPRQLDIHDFVLG